MLFAALRFYQDGNLADRLYWYASDCPVKEGEKVFAPVGERNRVQKAIVERVLHAEGDHAPYPPSLIKRIEPFCVPHTEQVGELLLTDLGGIRYDDRHYTRFHRLAFCEHAEPFTPKEQDMLAAAGYGPFCVGQTPAADDTKCVLIAGTGARDCAKKVIAAARGEEKELCYVTLARRIL